MHPDKSAASDQGRDRRGRTDAKPRVPGRANPTKTGGGKLVDLQAYAKRCDDRVEPSGKRSQPEAEQVPPVQDDRVQGPAGIRAASGPIPDTSFPRARGATWIAGAADDVEWDAPRAGIHPGIHPRHRSEDLPRGSQPQVGRASMRSFRCRTERGWRRQAEYVGDDGLGGAQHRGEQRRQVEVALACGSYDPQWAGQNRPFVGTSKPAISGGPRLELRSTSRRPLLATCLPAR